MKKNETFIYVSAIVCIAVCIGEFVALFVLGSFYPGFNHLKDTMSSLGASNSPVSNEISTWWVIMGLLFIFFATGLRKAFSEKGLYSKIAFWLIILYGFGEGVGSGAFKADHIANSLKTSAVIHDTLGGLGVIAVLILPLIMQKVITKNEMPVFYRLSKIVFIAGIVTVGLFLFRYSSDENNFFTLYKGLWQRLFMLNTYLYFSSIAFIMIKQYKKTKSTF